MLQEEIKKLEQVCRNLEGCIREGLSWVKENVPEENQKAIVYNLKKYNRTNRRYRQALGKRPAVTIFGESQVGKSYLVSNLAVKPGESNMLILDPSTDTTIDFIKEMNPKGGGAEATGLVSRFTIINNFKEGQPPFVLKLLSNADVVKIICNGYLSDLMQYSYKIDREEVANRLRKIKEKTLPAEQPGFSEDDVYELKEYLNHNFKDHFIIKELNDINYWDDISAIIPYLPNEERFTVFEVIWGTREFLTELFRNLTGILKQVEFSSEVRGYKEALTPQEQTILDVTRLSEYFMENISQKPVEVVLPGGSKIQANRSLITAVIAEVVLLLPPETAEAPNRGFLKSADILDFPGARSRKKIPEAIFLANSKVEKLEIFLRGKIAFLFDRYTYEHEISTLLFCLHEKQSEVQDIPHLLYEWIRVSHGASPEEREKREQNLKLLIGDADIERINPLLVVFTKFNIELTGSPSDKVGDPSSHDAKWTARFKRNFNEFMSPNVGDKWANQWTTSETDFKNCFLLRDPKFSKAVYTGLDSDNEGLETAINPNYVQRMDDMTESFLEHGYVKKHFRHPDASWKESTEPTKSGIDYITKYLTPTCNPIIRIERAKTLIQQLQESLYSELEVFYEGGDLQEKLKKANLNGSKVLMFLTGWNSKNSGFGSLLDKFMIREDEAWKVYWDLQNSAVIKEERKESAGEDISKMLTTTKETFQNLGINFDEGKKIEDNLEELQKFLGVDKESLAGLLEASGIEMEKLVSDRPASKKTKTEYYATSLISTWISKISELKTGDTLNEMGITKEISELTINELIENRKRTKLKEVIVENVHTEVSNFAFSNNFDIVAHISTVLVNDFVRTAGWKYIPDGERPKIKEVPVFSEANISTPAKENLQMNIKYPGINLFSQWVLGVKESFKANVLFSSNVKDDANVAANNMLGDILKKIR